MPDKTNLEWLADNLGKDAVAKHLIALQKAAQIIESTSNLEDVSVVKEALYDLAKVESAMQKGAYYIERLVGGDISKTSETILCPFHKEETPSMWLRYDTGRYSCFGCGARGLIVDLPKEKK